MLIYSADEGMGAGRLLRSTASAAGPVPAQPGTGPARLPAGNTTGDRTRVATILVRQLQPVIAAVGQAGGQIIEGPSPVPNGGRLIARHPDGSVFGYIQRPSSPGSNWLLWLT
jgi:predicted enzyme related to lactoylglutathione lyase